METVLNDKLHTYTWNSDNRPTAIDSLNLTYDALGTMVEQNRSGVYTQIVYAPGGQKFALMNGQTLQKAFVPLPGGGQTVYNSSGLLYYAHTDHLGSFRFASTPSRTMYFDMAYAPFGETYAASGSADASFTTQRQDTVAGLYDFPAREYSIQGRWPSPDPAGLASVDPTNPQSWNRYVYVMNDPLRFVDPLGLLIACGDWNSWCGAADPTGAGDPGSPGGPGHHAPLLDGPSGGGWCPPGDACDRTSNPPPAACTAGPSKIISGSLTSSAPTKAAGAYIGGLLLGPPGAIMGGVIGDFFGVGVSGSYVPSTGSFYLGPTVVVGLGGGTGASANFVNVPSTQNPNSIANGLSYSLTYQPLPFAGATVTKSPGSGPPVVGPSIGTRIPVSGGASLNFCVKNCGGC